MEKEQVIRPIQGNILLVTIFISGAVVMILEIVGIRAFAPFFGTSIYVWTAIIGVVLTSMSAGYYFGGRIADKSASIHNYSWLLLLSSVVLSMVGMLIFPVMMVISLMPLSMPLRGFVGAVVLFAAPAFILSMTAPYALKLMLRTLEEAGKTSGKVSSLSAAGSIVGTFLAGFVFIPMFGNTNIICGLAFLMFAAGVAVQPNLKHLKFKIICLLALIVSTLSGSYMVNAVHGATIEARETPYNTVWVIETIQGERPAINMVIGLARQSVMYLDSDELVGEYTRTFSQVAQHFMPNANNTLMLGGAGHIFSQYFLRNNSTAGMDVVEIDEVLTELAKAHFGLADTIELVGDRLNIYHEDGRAFLNRNTKRYDIIFSDVADAANQPFHLFTSEATQRVVRSLADDGIFVANVVNALEGNQSNFLRAYIRTLRRYFPHVYVFSPQEVPVDTIQNVVLVAARRQLELNSEAPFYNELQVQRYIGDMRTDLPILRDNHAPTEFYNRFILIR